MPHAPAMVLGIPGGPEWLVILLVVVLFFGKRIPGVARSLGSGITEFKHGLREGADAHKAGKQVEDSTDTDDGSKDESGS